MSHSFEIHCNYDHDLKTFLKNLSIEDLRIVGEPDFEGLEWQSDGYEFYRDLVSIRPIFVQIKENSSFINLPEFFSQGDFQLVITIIKELASSYNTKITAHDETMSLEDFMEEHCTEEAINIMVNNVLKTFYQTWYKQAYQQTDHGILTVAGPNRLLYFGPRCVQELLIEDEELDPIKLFEKMKIIQYAQYSNLISPVPFDVGNEGQSKGSIILFNGEPSFLTFADFIQIPVELNHDNEDWYENEEAWLLIPYLSLFELVPEKVYFIDDLQLITENIQEEWTNFIGKARKLDMMKQFLNS